MENRRPSVTIRLTPLSKTELFPPTAPYAPPVLHALPAQRVQAEPKEGTGGWGQNTGTSSPQHYLTATKSLTLPREFDAPATNRNISENDSGKKTWKSR